MHKFWRPPRLMQTLAEEERGETWLELFYDLVYVAVLIQLGNVLSEDVSWAGFGRFMLLFAPIWWAWSNFAFYMNRFAVDDVWHRLLIVTQIFFIAWIGLSVGGAFGDLSTQFVLLYVGFRLTMIALYWRTYVSVPEVRPLVRRYITDFHVVGAALWLLSLLLPVEWRPAVWLGTFIYEVFTSQRPTFIGLHERFPLRVEHLRERFGTLTLLVLGESFIKSITLESSLPITREALLFSIPGILALFGLWWLYFSDTEDDEGSVAHAGNPAIWLYTHLPLSFALVGFGVGVKKLFESAYEGHLNPEYIVLYCGSLIIYALAMTALNLLSDQPFHRQRAALRLGMALAMTAVMVLSINVQGTAVDIVLWYALIVVLQIAHDLYLARRSMSEEGLS